MNAQLPREPFDSTKLGRDYRAVVGRNGNRYIAGAKSPRTWGQYASALRVFSKWCDERGLRSTPPSADTLLAYVTDLADNDYAAATIFAYLQGISTASRIAGRPIDRTPISETLRGIRRLADRPRQAAPLLGEDLKALLSQLDPKRAADARDGAMLALGWAIAARQSELVGLDWQRRGAGQRKGTGVLRMLPDGLEVALIVSKTSQTKTVVVGVPTSEMPAASKWLTAWLAVSEPKAGEPVFHPIDRHGIIYRDRLGSIVVADIVKRRVRQHALAIGATPGEAAERCANFSGHSLRAGFITTAALAGVPEWRIRNRVRHRSAEMTARYIRAIESMKDTGLKEIGF